jgi:hypothetical protein
LSDFLLLSSKSNLSHISLANFLLGISGEPKYRTSFVGFIFKSLFFSFIAIKISPDDEEILKQIAVTAMTGKGAEHAKEKLAEVIVKAIKQIQVNGKVDLDDIKIEKSKGEEAGDTHLISGIVLTKSPSANEPEIPFNQ